MERFKPDNKRYVKCVSCDAKVMQVEITTGTTHPWWFPIDPQCAPCSNKGLAATPRREKLQRAAARKRRAGK